MTREIHVYTPYYLSEDFSRQKELDLCLRRNVELASIGRIFLMVDDGHRPDILSDKISFIDMDHRPTYADWIDLTGRNSTDAISILANTDIHFDETIISLDQLFDTSEKVLLALSRYEVKEDTIALHKNPHWSQDVWAVDGRRPIPTDLRQKISIPLGIPRCDNKIAYLFAVYGYDVFNPCNFVRTYHLHETELRAYDGYLDTRILGGTAWVYPSEALARKSELAFDIWTLQGKQDIKSRVNFNISSNIQWGLGKKPVSRSSAIVAYDCNWQFPAITEQHAFERLNQDLHLRNNDGSVVYLAFPWATLIDNLMHNKKNPGRAEFFRQKLLSLRPKLRGARTIVTTCQHIHMLRYQDLFQDMGVTDIFWSHATKGQESLPDYPEISVYPFPLYAVQAKDQPDASGERKHLYSFVGAKANQYYLTDSRNIIIDDLARTGTGYITGNETWHYNKVVYDHQVRGIVDKPDALVDNSASDKFRRILLESVFSLCPSGTGPNSIRLWESIGLGAIPVILADTLALPGNPALWEEAAVFCKEDRDSILELPARLQAMHGDPELLKRKRHAMAQLWALYGLDNFVHDIRGLMLQKSQFYQIVKNQASPALPARSDTLQPSLGLLVTDILSNPGKVRDRILADRSEIAALVSKSSREQQDVFYRALNLRNLQDLWEKG